MTDTVEIEHTSTRAALRPSAIANDYRGAFASVAYLLRSLRRAVWKGETNDHRKREFPRELTSAIEGEHTDGDTCAVWLTKLARRWDVALAGDADGRGLRVFFPDGHAAWDVVACRVPVVHLGRIVESADLLASFACRFGPMPGRDDAEVEAEIDAAILDVSEPARPTAPWVPEESLFGVTVEPARWCSLWTAESTFAHGADDRTGNVVGIRRQPMTDLVTGEPAEVPFYAGNAARGACRRALFGDLIASVGLTVPEVSIPVAHSLLDGGTLEGGSPSVDAALRRALRALLPAVDLYGCNWNRTETMGGWLLMEPAVLVCRESAGLLARVLAPSMTAAAWRDTLLPAAELVSQQQLTSNTEELADNATKVLARVEVVNAGSRFFHRVGLHGRAGYGEAPVLVQSALAHLLNLLRSRGAVGAANSRGMGRMLIGEYTPRGGAKPLPSATLYLEHVEAHREEIRDLLTAPVKGGAEPAAEKPAKGAKRSAKSKGAPVETVASAPVEGGLFGDAT